MQPERRTNTKCWLRFPPPVPPHLLHKERVDQPHCVEMSSQGTVSSKKAGTIPGLCRVKGQ